MKLLRSREVAEMLCVHPDTLRAWRRSGRGPAYVRVEGQVFYRPDDVEAYLASVRVEAAQ